MSWRARGVGGPRVFFSALSCSGAVLLVASAATALSAQDPTLDGRVAARIAVLPMETAGCDTADSDLGLALAAEVTHWLLHVPDLVVRSTDAIPHHEPSNPGQLADDLDVDHLVSGALTRSNTSFTVEYWLRRWPEGAAVTSGTESVPENELPLLSLRIARRVAGALPVDGASTRRLSSRAEPPPRISSYATFLKALASRPTTARQAEERIRGLETAVQVTDYPPALTLLGRLYLDRAGEIGGRGPYYDLAEKMLERALALAPDSPSARHLLASLCAKRGRSERTATLIREGLATHPLYAGFHETFGYVLRYAGLMDESVAAYRRAQKLDGGLESLVSTQGQITKSLIYKEDYAGAFVSHRRMLEHLERIQRAPNEKQVFYEGMIHLYAGERARAIECFQRATAIDPDSVWTIFGRAYQGMLQDDRARVADIVERLEQRVVVDGERRYRLVHFCAFLGREDAALEHLETAIDGGFFNSPYVGTDPLLDSLRAHPRYPRLLERAERRHKAFRRLLARPYAWLDHR